MTATAARDLTCARVLVHDKAHLAELLDSNYPRFPVDDRLQIPLKFHNMSRIISFTWPSPNSL
jgi:hypothetical protein